ncbi:alpha/beta fold hydrolase [Pseudonocardia sp. CA-107938]|uniref:alpha/beta fold hydrolase n=1 Tax=Pseudonocardia sp. CA-107938 TaxID=3240021 RepID=UPI003D8D197D
MTNFQHDKVLEALQADREFTYAIRDWTVVIRLQRGSAADDLTIEGGRAVAFAAATGDAFDVRIIGTEDGWAKLLSGDPAARYALLTGTGPGLQVESDFMEHQVGYGQALRRLVRVLRQLEGTPAEEGTLTEDPFAETDIAVGRYLRFEVDEVQYRMYYEEAGAGEPLLLQHTAGADSRQWRHLLADPELQKRYRMIAYDLPFHGRSLPPVVGARWWEQAYEPGRELLMKWVVAFKNALGLDRPLIMGVSVGGQLASDILAFQGDEIGGAISVNGTYHNDSLGYLDNSPFDNPRVPREYFSSLMYEISSPIAPEALRRENQWIYSSNGPGVYKGDNLYYSGEHDLRVDGHLIDTARTPMYATVGEFDPVNGIPGGPQEIPDNIPGARFAVLPQLSHFAMADDPVRFNAAIAPILDEVADEMRKVQGR